MTDITPDESAGHKEHKNRGRVPALITYFVLALVMAAMASFLVKTNTDLKNTRDDLASTQKALDRATSANEDLSNKLASAQQAADSCGAAATDWHDAAYNFMSGTENMLNNLFNSNYTIDSDPFFQKAKDAGTQAKADDCAADVGGH